MERYCQWICSVFIAVLLLRVQLGMAGFEAGTQLRSEFSLALKYQGVQLNYYSGFAPGLVTVDNQSEAVVVFRSVSGYVAEIPPHAMSELPCTETPAIAGAMLLAKDELQLPLSEQALCGDLLTVRGVPGNE